jgi:hypothetical protein
MSGIGNPLGDDVLRYQKEQCLAWISQIAAGSWVASPADRRGVLIRKEKTLKRAIFRD